MSFKLSISLLCFLILSVNACDSKSGAGHNSAQANASQASSVAKSEAKPEAIDTCALIEKSEIASVQGVEVQQTQPTIQKHGDLAISQCYYTAISADGSKNLSVYVQVIHRDPKSDRLDALKEFWEKRFGRESKEKTREEKENKEREEDEEEAINPPLPISGIGDEAFWLGSSRGGALYVLRKDKVVRVTVGGADDAKAQIEKSKTLAKKALARLM
jgi:hypothetical protein